MPTFTENLQSVDQTAVRNGWSPKRVRTLIRDGLPVVTIGRQSLINPETLETYLREREAPKAGEQS
jgi:hypothetical protein